MKVSIGKLANMFGISRTALLYYDKIGLLCPTLRSAAGYRLYEDSDIHRLQRIMMLRNAGVSLNRIGSILEAEESLIIGMLMKRLGEINLEIQNLKEQQRQIIDIVSNTSFVKNIKNMDLQLFEKIIQSAGIDFNQKDLWHSEFERQSPEQHQYFLRVLGFSEEEVRTFIHALSH